MANGFELRFDFVENWGRFAKAEYLQVFIYTLSHFKKNKKMLTAKDVAKMLEKDIDVVNAAFDFWIAAGLMSMDGGKLRFVEQQGAQIVKAKPEKQKADTKKQLRTRPSYDAAEIDAAASVNKNIDYLFRESERILKKILSPSDFELIYSFVDWLGLPVEVVVMLLNFAAKRGKTGKRYLETVAIDWAEKGIDNVDTAEEYVRELELKQSNEGKIRGILGIYDRTLSQTEKKYINLWTTEKNISPELVAEAYDRTVAATGKLSWAYMNKIIMKWADEGITDINGVHESEVLFKLKSAATKQKIKTQKGKLVNYEDTNKPDYSKFAEKILEDMLEE